MPLEASQTAFAGALLNPDAKLPDGIVDPEGKPAPKRFAVYRNNVTVSLIEALETAFPTVARIVGTEFFAAMAREFARSHPPSSPLLMLYGAEFAEFLEGFAPVAHLPYLPDIARLEHLRRIAYHAADAEPLQADFLGTIAPEQVGSATFSIHPSVQLLQGLHPVLSIWEWNNVAEDAEKPSIPHEAEAVLIARPHLDVEVRRLPLGGFAFLQSLADGATLGVAATAGSMAEGFDLTQNIAGLIESRIVTAFALDGAAP